MNNTQVENTPSKTIYIFGIFGSQFFKKIFNFELMSMFTTVVSNSATQSMVHGLMPASEWFLIGPQTDKYRESGEVLRKFTAI